MSRPTTTVRVFPQQTYGPVLPTGMDQPVREVPVRFGKGLLIEEGTTNLDTDPSFVTTAGVNAWVATAGTRTQATDRGRIGTTGIRVLGAGVTGRVGKTYTGLTGGTPFTFTAWAYAESVTTPAASALVLVTDGAAPVTVIGTTAATVADVGRWVEHTSTVTLPADATSVAVQMRAGVATVVFDAVQAESKPYRTSYADGNMAPAFDAPGNLLPLAAQSFEDGTTGGWVARANTSTLASSTLFAAAGSRSLVFTCVSAGTASAQSAVGTAGVPVVPGRTYSASVAALTASGRTVAAALAFYKADGTATGAATPGTAVATSGTSFVRAVQTIAAPADAAFVAAVAVMGTGAAGDLVYADAARVSEGTADAAYRWNGAERASTSTRATGRVSHGQAPAMNLDSDSITLSAWGRFLPRAATVNYLLVDDNSTANRLFFAVGTNGTPGGRVTKGSTTTSLPVIAPTAPGDVIFQAVTLTPTTVTHHFSVNGGPLVSSSLAVTGTANAPVSRVFATGGAFEQIALHKAALSAAEVAALAFGGPLDFEDDPRLVFLYATGDPEGYNALSTTGLGRTRNSRPSTVGLLDTDLAAEWNPTGAAAAIELPAGSGFGEGDTLQLDTGQILRAMRVVSVGTSDLVYVG